MIYQVMSRHQDDKIWRFNSRIERDTFAAELSKSGFETRHGVYKMDPDDDNTVNPYHGTIAKYGNSWY